MPSVLDALGVAPQIIAPYVGRSILRERSTEGDRTLVVTESPGNTTPMYLEQDLLLAQMNGGHVQVRLALLSPADRSVLRRQCHGRSDAARSALLHRPAR